ncbi:pyridine nucleotide-disulfide oxidoreductase [Botrytis cinerea]
MSQIINVDYLVVGAGAMGMAFVDTLFTDNKDVTFAIVDRYNRPGGHWTKAYPFVRLHQPSNCYGVNSRELGEDKIDTYSVGNETRIVDATFMRVKVPSMSPPVYSVADDVKLITPNGLAQISRPYANYTVVGAGKTGIDACLWMLSMGIEPSKITWIMPRDSWLWDRGFFQTEKSFIEKSKKALEVEAEGVMSATSITASEVTLEDGKFSSVPDTLYIDCSADGLKGLEPVPVFNDKHITLQAVRYCQQVFSAALIAHVEAVYDNDEKKNSLCNPIPHPSKSIDWLGTKLRDYENTLLWNAEPKMTTWLSQSRLNLYRYLQPSLPEDSGSGGSCCKHLRKSEDCTITSSESFLMIIMRET